MKNRWLWIGALLCGAFAASTVEAQARPKKLIATGWDSPTTAQFRRDLALMENLPLDGTSLWAQAQGPDLPAGLNTTPFRTAFSRTPWQRAWFSQAIADLQAVRGTSGRLTDNFLRVDANPGDVDWFDDEGWREIADHFRIAAWIAREGGLKGIVFDAEPYTKPFVPFDYKAQPRAAEHSFDEYLAKARQRGQEVMAAMAAEYPDLTVLTFFMNAYLVDANPHHGPSAAGLRDARPALFLHAYGLYPAFIDGWLDVLPSSATLVDGNEHAYGYTTPAEFYLAAARIKGDGQELVSPANRAKYRQQVQVGFGLYLDAHDPLLDNPYRLPDASADLLGRNAAAALAAADEYVWLWGEQGRWWPEPGALSEWPNKTTYPRWEARLPGAEAALAQAHDPAAAAEGAARAEFGQLVQGGKVHSLLTNGDFSRGPDPAPRAAASSDWQISGAPAQWSFWQEELCAGTFTWDEVTGAARAAGVRDGVFIQTAPVQPGQRFYVNARCRTQGKGAPTLTIAWKKADLSWLGVQANKVVFLPAALAPSPAGWSTWGGWVATPPDAAFMVLMLGAAGQPTAQDQLWWDEVQLVPLPER